jgi:hypothetical protein
MKTQVKGPVLAAIVAAALAVLGYFGYKSMSTVGSLDNGQVKYTPGTPPWLEKDPSKRGPGASPPIATSAAPPQAPNMPVGPPVVDNSAK